jgi:hypothetical protein
MAFFSTSWYVLVEFVPELSVPMVTIFKLISVPQSRDDSTGTTKFWNKFKSRFEMRLH